MIPRSTPLFPHIEEPTMPRSHSYALISLLLVSLAATAHAQATGDANDDDRTRFSVGASLGFIDTPGGVSLGFEAPLEITHNFAVGPWLTLGLADKFTNVVATANARYYFDIADSGNAARLRPFVQGGLGLDYTDDDAALIDEANFLLATGLGIEYAIDENIALTSQAMFNIIPYARRGRTFTASVQLLGMRYRF
jgi:outer membrane protein W